MSTWRNHVEYLNNIYQKGAVVTCVRRPMAKLWGCEVIRRQLGAQEEAAARFLQTTFLRVAGVSVPVGLKRKEKKNHITE